MFGLIVGTIEIIAKAIEIYEAVKDKSGIPRALREVSKKLPSVKDLLSSADVQYQSCKLDNNTWDSAKQDVEHCKELCQELQDLLISAYPSST